MNLGNAVGAALLTCRHCHGLPVGLFFLCTFAFEAQYAVRRVQRQQAAHPQFGGFLHQPVHALVGRHAHCQVNGPGGFAVTRVVRAHGHGHVAAAHAGDGGGVLTALPVEQGDVRARLQAQHLHMPRRTGGQL